MVDIFRSLLLEELNISPILKIWPLEESYTGAIALSEKTLT